MMHPELKSRKKMYENASSRPMCPGCEFYEYLCACKNSAKSSAMLLNISISDIGILTLDSIAAELRSGVLLLNCEQLNPQSPKRPTSFMVKN
jgi:hypothetical protein